VRGEFNRGGDRLYVLHKYSPYLGVFDPTSLSFVRRVYVGSGGMALKVDARTDLVYLSRQGTGEVAIYNPFSLLPVGSFRTAGGEPSCLAIDGEGNTLVVPLQGTDGVRAIRLIGNETAWEIDVGEDPYWVTLMGER
jgi:DNA-binding beta-propeller fold protein YncE